MESAKLKFTRDYMARGQINDQQLDHCLSQWWHNPAQINLRLTKVGWQYLVAVLKIPNYTFNIPLFSSKVLLLLDRKMDSPYYIHNKYAIPNAIVLFSESDAMMMALIDNNITRLLTDMKD